MPGLYKSSGYNLDRMELKFMWLDSQVERINEEEEQKRKETSLTSHVQLKAQE